MTHTALGILLAYIAGGLLQVLQRMPSMLVIWEDPDGTIVSNEPHREAVAIQRMGHGHDWKINPPSSKGHQWILAITDYFTKLVEAVPMK